MRVWLRKYWPELLVFGGIFAVLVLCCAPDRTWINTDSDGIHYVYSAKYLYPAHKTSAPLFLLLGHVFLWLPMGSEFWRMALLSVVASMVSAWFIYAIVKEKTNKACGLIAALIFGGSALVISQSTIVETYALVTMFGLGAYYFAIKQKWLWCAVMLGAGSAVHHLIFIPLIVMLAFYKGLRKWKYIGTMSAFLLFYLYIPITVAVNNPPDMWGNAALSTFLIDTSSTGLMLIGGLSIWDLPKRILDALGILGTSLGLAGIVIIWRLVSKNLKGLVREPLVWLFLLPIIYYITDLAPQTYVYMMPAIGFGAVIAGVTLYKMRAYWKWAVLGVAIGLLAFNANYFDIGRTLDPELSAKKFYTEELSKIPDGQILMAQQGWEWAAVFPYNKEHSSQIRAVYVGTLASSLYRDLLRSQGIKLDSPPDTDQMHLFEVQDYVVASILEKNENIWTTLPTTPETYGTEIVRVEGHEETLINTSTQVPTVAKVKWRPDNPYDIITGAIEVEEWVWILLSNYSCLTFVMLGVIGFVPVWIGWQVIVKRKRWRLRKNVREVKNND